jgi:hypothetical protein
MGRMGKGFFTAENAELAEEKRKSMKILDGITGFMADSIGREKMVDVNNKT